MTFTEVGKLTYKISGKEKTQIINLIFWIKDNFIFTDQPSHPKVEITKYHFESNDLLVLTSNGIRSRYKRVVE